jgi:hypothetical protein
VKRWSHEVTFEEARTHLGSGVHRHSFLIDYRIDDPIYMVIAAEYLSPQTNP